MVFIVQLISGLSVAMSRTTCRPECSLNHFSNHCYSEYYISCWVSISGKKCCCEFNVIFKCFEHHTWNLIQLANQIKTICRENTAHMNVVSIRATTIGQFTD